MTDDKVNSFGFRQSAKKWSYRGNNLIYAVFESPKGVTRKKNDKILKSGTHLYFSFDKTGNVIFIVKDRQSVEEILLQPVPVLVYFL